MKNTATQLNATSIYIDPFNQMQCSTNPIKGITLRNILKAFMFLKAKETPCK